MLGYDPIRLENTLTVKAARRLFRMGFLSEGQLELVKRQLPGCVTSRNLFVRAGLFFLGMLLAGACSGVLALIVFPVYNSGPGPYYFVLGLFGATVLELLLVRRFLYWGQGLDDVLLLFTLASFGAFVNDLLADTSFAGLRFLLMALLCLFACLRYADALSAVLGLAALAAFVADICMHLGPGSHLLPFAIMLLSTLVLITLNQFRKRRQIHPAYALPMSATVTAAAVLLCLSGNYYVVREAGVELLGFSPGNEIPYYRFFYFFTVACPLAFIGLALRNHRRALLWAGMLGVLGAVLTIRHYHSIMPAERALMLGGGIVFLLAVCARYLLGSRNTGLTFVQDRQADDGLLAAETLALLTRHGMDGGHARQQHEEFGEGEFGGAGSGQKY